jgi:hypothetical protein
MYKIGDWVEVRAVAKEFRGAKPNHKIWCSESLRHPRIGQVVGKTCRFEGIINHGSYSGMYGEEYDPGSLDITARKEFWLVRFGMMNKPVLVCYADMIPVNEHPIELPRLARK